MRMFLHQADADLGAPLKRSPVTVGWVEAQPMAGVSEDQWKIMVEDDIQGVFFLDFWIVFLLIYLFCFLLRKGSGNTPVGTMKLNLFEPKWLA